jgi:thiamine biosynthesis protein ThiI
LPWELVRERVAAVFGIANFAPAHEVPLDLEALKAAAVASLRSRTFGSFRVTTKRSYKGFSKNSGEIDREVGAAVNEATGVRVDLEHPELTLYVEVLRDRIFYSYEKHKGPGGFPVGSSGRVIAAS